MASIPDLATNSPTWLLLVSVGVNAVVGALRGYTDDSERWDIVGVSVFALLMGLGGGFIRDMLIGNLPAQSLRTPKYLLTVLGCIVVVVLVGKYFVHLAKVVSFLNALALGLFAVTGSSYAQAAHLPAISCIFVGTVSAVGGGVLVSVMKDEVPSIMLASAPNSLLALLASCVFMSTSHWHHRLGSLIGVASAVLAQYLVQALGIETRPATNASAVLFTRVKRPKK